MRIVPLLLSATVIVAAMFPTSSAGLTLVQGQLQDPGLDRAGFVGYPGFEVAGDYRYPRLELSSYISYSARRYERPVRPVRRPYRRPSGVRIRSRSTGEVLWVGNQPGGSVVVAQKAATKDLAQERGPAPAVLLRPPEVEGAACDEVDLPVVSGEAPCAELADAEWREDEADASPLLVLESRAALWAADLCLARISQALAAAACPMAFLLRSARIPEFTVCRHTAHPGILRAPCRQCHLAAPRDAILEKCGLESRVEAHAAWRGGANGGTRWLQPAAVRFGNRRRLSLLRI